MTFKECRGDLPHDNVANVKVQRLRVAHAKTKIRRGLHFLTTQTSITLLLAFSPSAIARPPTSVNLLAFCAMRRYKSNPGAKRHSFAHVERHNTHISCIHAKTPHSVTDQKDGLQALESTEVQAQRLNVVILELVRGARKVDVASERGSKDNTSLSTRCISSHVSK